MTQYNKDIKTLVDALASEILKIDNLTQKKLDALIKKLYKGLDKPTAQFLKRVQAMALEQVISAENAMVKTLVALAKTENIRSLTAKELKVISTHALTKNLIFTKWKNKDRKSFIVEEYNMEDAINALPLQISRDFRRRALGGMIAGDTPAKVAASLMDRNLSKKIRRNIRTLYRTTAYKARTLSNIETMSKNEKYFDYYRFVTMDDDRVTTVCMELAARSEKMTWTTKDKIPIEAYTPVHFNCRCQIQPTLNNK